MNNDLIYESMSRIMKIDTKKLKKVSMETSLSDIGLTSLLTIALIVDIEKQMNIEILDSDLTSENFKTVGTLFQMLSKYTQKKINKKVLIVDADGVLWKGVAGEETLLIDKQVIELQRKIIQLYNNGVLICICSKNQIENINDAFSLQNMILKREHFTLIVANKNDKVKNIHYIAKKLNLGIDSFVFVDDNDYEVGFVSLNLPEVFCIKFDHDNFEFFDKKMNTLFTATVGLDINRTQLYREQMNRERDKNSIISVEDYNKLLKTEIFFEKAMLQSCERLSELSKRTNQFNLSNKRYSKEEIKSLILSDDYDVFVLSIKDKYGDMGIVAMAVLKNNVIEALMMSCRVLGRDFELYFLERIKEKIGSKVYGCYKMTEKNKLYSAFYSNNGVITI